MLNKHVEYIYDILNQSTHSIQTATTTTTTTELLNQNAKHSYNHFKQINASTYKACDQTVASQIIRPLNAVNTQICGV